MHGMHIHTQVEKMIRAMGFGESAPVSRMDSLGVSNFDLLPELSQEEEEK